MKEVVVTDSITKNKGIRNSRLVVICTGNSVWGKEKYEY